MATIADLLAEGSIDLSLSAGNKNDTIERMVDLIGASGALVHRDVLLKAVRAREDVGTTGLGDGIAIPHGKCDGVDRPALAFARSDEGVDWGAPVPWPTSSFSSLFPRPQLVTSTCVSWPPWHGISSRLISATV